MALARGWLDYAVGRPVKVTGSHLELTAENIDSVGNPYLDGAHAVSFIEGPLYLIVASKVVRRPLTGPEGLSALFAGTRALAATYCSLALLPARSRQHYEDREQCHAEAEPCHEAKERSDLATRIPEHQHP